MSSSSKPPVVAIGLDSADPILVRRWMSAGYLPNLSRLCDGGAYGEIDGVKHYKAETPWNIFLTGMLPQANGYWGEIRLQPNSYEIQDVQAYDFTEYPPFYALGDQYRVAVFDVPKARLNSDVNGRQMLAWGAHSPSTPRVSRPTELFQQIESKFGPHPTFEKDHGDWWDRRYLHRLRRGLEEGIHRRCDICKNWLSEEPWDLFLTVFSETHSAGHDFHFLSDPEHPLYGERSRFFPDEDPLLEIYKATDQAIGRLLEVAPQNAYIVVFSLHGSGSNTTDVPAMFFLAEFLYRFSFPSEPGRLAVGDLSQQVPPLCVSPKWDWSNNIWRQQYDQRPIRRILRKTFPYAPIDQLLGSPGSVPLGSMETLKQRNPFFWQPASWYQSAWPEMQAFALPSFSEGYIRLNVKGREPQGRVAPVDYQRMCDELMQALYELKNPRTGKATVKEVTQMCRDIQAEDPYSSDADLIVEWHEHPADVIDSPQYGRIGPVPFRRTGSHRPRGFVIVQGADIKPGSSLPRGRQTDITATLLSLMNAPIPQHIQGKPLVQPCAPFNSGD